MCLLITIRVSHEADQAVLESLGLKMPVPVCRVKRGSHKATDFNVSDDGCACSLLTEQADCNAPTWDMRDDARERLAQTVEALGEELPGGFSLEALWIGETPDLTHSVTAHELADLARGSGLGTKARYEVTRREA